MKFKTFSKKWLLNELESPDLYSYINRQAALYMVVGFYRNYFSRIRRLSVNQLLQVCSILRNETFDDILDSIKNDFSV